MDNVKITHTASLCFSFFRVSNFMQAVGNVAFLHDLKSPAFTGVKVRVFPWAPLFLQVLKNK
ncbi:MAG: hypothetical protein FalmKO_44910 [Falsiruegeria mediterranea]